MANNIALAEKFLPVLDEKYSTEAKTAMFDGDNGEITYIENNIAKVYKLDVDGFGDYDRNTGFPAGSVTGVWETLELKQDRGVKFEVDRFDNDETMGLAFGRLFDTFTKQKYAPEIDAYRIMKYAAGTGLTVGTGDITVGTTDVANLIDAGFQAMMDANAYEENSEILISAKAYAGLKSKITRYLANETEVNRIVETYDGHRVTWLPQDRMNTLITLNDGTTDFGYDVTAGGYPINFLIVNHGAVVNAKNWYMPKFFSADDNQQKDANILQLRLYYDAFVLDNKAKGVYVHRGTTANQ